MVSSFLLNTIIFFSYDKSFGLVVLTVLEENHGRTAQVSVSQWMSSSPPPLFSFFFFFFFFLNSIIVRLEVQNPMYHFW